MRGRSARGSLSELRVNRGMAIKLAFICVKCSLVWIPISLSSYTVLFRHISSLQHVFIRIAPCRQVWFTSTLVSRDHAACRP